MTITFGEREGSAEPTLNAIQLGGVTHFDAVELTRLALIRDAFMEKYQLPPDHVEIVQDLIRTPHPQHEFWFLLEDDNVLVLIDYNGDDLWRVSIVSTDIDDFER